MWQDKLKELGVSIHVIATGAGAGLQQDLWSIPGSSAYLSGASFPYSNEETEELLGFKPEHACSEETAIELASAAYMKAYKLGGKKPVGVGITASVASEKIHRGEHRVYACIITDDQVRTVHHVFEKGIGLIQRELDGLACDDIGMFLLMDTLKLSDQTFETPANLKMAEAKAFMQFMEHPFFTMDGKRYTNLPKANSDNAPFDVRGFAMMSGAFNPPHPGHLGMADGFQTRFGKRVIFEVTATPPHKPALSVQELLKRAKMLAGRDRFFSTNIPMYLDKARDNPGMPLILGADAVIRLLDPKWGLDIDKMFKEFYDLGTYLYVAGRDIDGKFTTRQDIFDSMPLDQTERRSLFARVTVPLDGRWNISSTEIRNKLL